MRNELLIIGVVVTGLLASAATGFAEGDGEMIPAGDPFVEFELEAHDGSTVSSGDLNGRPYLLFFYPKADTPG